MTTSVNATNATDRLFTIASLASIASREISTTSSIAGELFDLTNAIVDGDEVLPIPKVVDFLFAHFDSDHLIWSFINFESINEQQFARVHRDFLSLTFEHGLSNKRFYYFPAETDRDVLVEWLDWLNGC